MASYGMILSTILTETSLYVLFLFYLYARIIKISGRHLIFRFFFITRWRQVRKNKTGRAVDFSPHCRFSCDRIGIEFNVTHCEHGDQHLSSRMHILYLYACHIHATCILYNISFVETSLLNCGLWMKVLELDPVSWRAG